MQWSPSITWLANTFAAVRLFCMQKLIVSLSLLVASLMLVACAHTKQPPAAGAYFVTRIDGQDARTPQPITVTYTGERLLGKGPVNNWAMPVDANGKIGDGIATRMAGPPELMQLEDSLFRALTGGTLVTGPGNGAVVTKDGKDVIVLQPAVGGQ